MPNKFHPLCKHNLQLLTFVKFTELEQKFQESTVVDPEHLTFKNR